MYKQFLSEDVIACVVRFLEVDVRSLATLREVSRGFAAAVSAGNVAWWGLAFRGHRGVWCPDVVAFLRAHSAALPRCTKSVASMLTYGTLCTTATATLRSIKHKPDPFRTIRQTPLHLRLQLTSLEHDHILFTVYFCFGCVLITSACIAVHSVIATTIPERSIALSGVLYAFLFESAVGRILPWGADVEEEVLPLSSLYGEHCGWRKLCTATSAAGFYKVLFGVRKARETIHKITNDNQRSGGYAGFTNALSHATWEASILQQRTRLESNQYEWLSDVPPYLLEERILAFQCVASLSRICAMYALFRCVAIPLAHVVLTFEQILLEHILLHLFQVLLACLLSLMQMSKFLRISPSISPLACFDMAVVVLFLLCLPAAFLLQRLARYSRLPGIVDSIGAQLKETEGEDFDAQKIAFACFMVCNSMDPMELFLLMIPRLGWVMQKVEGVVKGGGETSVWHRVAARRRQSCWRDLSRSLLLCVSVQCLGPPQGCFLVGVCEMLLLCVQFACTTQTHLHYYQCDACGACRWQAHGCCGTSTVRELRRAI